jgi:tyrosine-protein kinase Etk/Wzc
MRHSTESIDFEETEESSLGDIVYRFLPYWPFFVLLLLITMAGAWIYLRYKMPVYQTTATILIKDDKDTNPNSDVLEAFDLFGSKKNVENEAEVLQSKTLMQEVVKNLHLYAPVTVEGRVSNQSAYVVSPIVVEVNNPDSLQDVKKVPFKYYEATQLVNIENKNYPLNQWVNTPFEVSSQSILSPKS